MTANRILLLALFLIASRSVAQKQLLDGFEKSSDGEVVASDGVEVKISTDPGISGSCLRIDFIFHAGSGYGGVRRKLNLCLPTNYQFSFTVKGEVPQNNFEFKLADTTGDNVWWMNRRAYQFPSEWRTLTVKKRHIEFAWGPRGGGEISRVGSVEFILSAGEGGKGTIWLDNFMFEQRPEGGYTGTPHTRASSMRDGKSTPEMVLDNDPGTAWRSQPAPEAQWLEIDFGQPREFSGIDIDWEQGRHAREFSIALSDDGNTWSNVYRVKRGRGSKAYIPLFEQEARFLRINMEKRATTDGYAIRTVGVKDVGEWNSRNDLFFSIARDALRGDYPRYFLKEQSYWTVVGVGGDAKEALINEEGMIETGKLDFSIEPFCWVDGKLLTWNEATSSQQLEEDYLPIPSVRRKYKDFDLNVTAFAEGEAGKSVLFVTYEVRNTSMHRINGNLYLALRPFQVLPPTQWLNVTGGVSRIGAIEKNGRVMMVNGAREILLLSEPDGFGAAEFEQGDITTFLHRNQLPSERTVTDGQQLASAALKYAFDLAAGAAQIFYVAVPFYSDKALQDSLSRMRSPSQHVQRALRDARKFWESKLQLVDIKLPPSAQKIVNILKSTLAYILINRDGSAIQPGSRNYERAWIRDGSLTSSALLRMGLKDEVREYIDWYATYQYPIGKVPCVVDRRGPDPVPEHDSHGQLIYAIAQYYRFTKDTSFLRSKWTNVIAAIDYIQSLRAERMTDKYKSGELRAYYGLVPESISHEGYSAKPMHSYWDDFFVLRGFKDAAYIASELREQEYAARYSALVNEFRTDLDSSIALAMKAKNIEYIPGSVELGDFDATSTAIGIYPGGELNSLPRAAVERTFERYYEYFDKRSRSAIEWKDYTPYEIRVSGTFLHLGRKDRTHAMLDFFFKDQRPPGWNHWAEVVRRNPRQAGFIGDMPHTWVGSDYISVIRTMFAYEREEDTTLVIGLGIPEAWVDSPAGVAVKNLPTYFGTLGFSMKAHGSSVVVRFNQRSLQGFGRIIVLSPRSRPIRKVLVDGKERETHEQRTVTLERVPKEIVLGY